MKSALAVALTFAAASAVSARQADPGVAALPPEQAAGQARMGCVAHAINMAPIAAVNAQALASNGMVFSESYPPFLRAQAQNEFGKGAFAHVPSTEGQVWVAGYDTGACIVTVIGTPDVPVVQRLEQLFAIPGGWKPAQIKQLPGARWSAYEWDSPKSKLEANMSVTELPPKSPVKGFVSVTIAPKSTAKN